MQFVMLLFMVFTIGPKTDGPAITSGLGGIDFHDTGDE